MKWALSGLKYLVYLLQLLPLILDAVKSLEVFLPLHGHGKAKLDHILGTVEDVYRADEQMQKDIQLDKLKALVTTQVNRAVATANAAGVFEKSTAPA